MKLGKIPKNCTECPFTRSCNTFYGHISCSFHKEITQGAIARLFNRSKKK